MKGQGRVTSSPNPFKAPGPAPLLQLDHLCDLLLPHAHGPRIELAWPHATGDRFGQSPADDPWLHRRGDTGTGSEGEAANVVVSIRES